MRVVNLKKVYKTKEQSVAALNGVSFDLPEKGMVFILGKSGSGKSTLLNVLSGLDKADEGIIEVCGKDITKLSANELSDYRNTCCGFVFQEYNLIPELNVGENIMLSLQLQGEKNADEKLKKVLVQVELSGYENRKVTELSGGQKQRVAIARAIIKNPQIIFADEPTGALDEQTGNSIFELLKNLSKEKLIIVVSHDRDFAQKYADRIIELADGKIISDNGACEVRQSATVIEFKKPKLPAKSAIKIGCSNFKYHPIRLVLTILLSVFTFTFFGVSLNVSFLNYQNVVYNTMQNQNVANSAIYKYYQNSAVPVKESEKQSIAHSSGQTIGIITADIEIDLREYSDCIYYSVLPYGYAEISEDIVKEFNFSYTGTLPQAENEIALSEYTAEVVGYLNFSETDVSRWVDKYITINGQNCLITAIVDTNFNSEKYSALKGGEESEALVQSFANDLNYSLHNYIFTGNIAGFCHNNISLSGESASLYLSESYSVKISELIKAGGDMNVYKLSGGVEGNYISATHIPNLLKLKYCSITHKGAMYSNYGDLFIALCDEEGGEYGADLYISVYQNYKDVYSFPTEFACSFRDSMYAIGCEVEVNGFFTDCGSGTIVLSDELYQSFYERIGGEYDGVFVSCNNAAVKSYISQNGELRLVNNAVESVDKYWDTISSIKTISYVLSGIFALFSIVLLLNFMLQSVTDKTKVIGILKANGCNDKVLAKIFIAEGIIIASAVFAVSALTVTIIFIALASRFSGIALFSVNAAIYPVLLAVIALFSVLGTLLPIARLSRFTPNDIIIRGN